MNQFIPSRSLLINTSQVILLVTLAVVALWIIWQLHQIIFFLLLSGLLSCALYPAISWLKETQRLPKRLSILGFYILFILLASGFTLLVIDLAMEQLDQLIHKLPTYSESATELLGRLPLWPNQTDLINLITDNLGSLSQQVLNVLVSSVNYVMSFIKGLFGILTILVFAFFLMTDTEYFEHLALKIVPESQRKTISLFLRKLAKQIGLYVRGQFLVMTAVGLLTGVGLALIGVHYALVLGLLSFLLDLIPIIGPLFATALGILVTLGENPNLVPWALLVYIVAQQIENYLLYPVILGRAVGLRPFWILLSLMCGGTLLGIVGVLLAIPAAITIHLIYMHLKSNRLPGEATA